MKKEIFVLCDTKRDVSEDEYKEYCLDNGIEYDPFDEEAYYNFCDDTLKMEYDDMLMNLCEIKFRNNLLITGTLGLWNGRKEICPMKIDNLEDAVKKCYGRCDDVKVTYKNGMIEVEAYHHDGTNCFEIRPLSYLGEKATRDWENGCQYFDKEPKEYWFTKMKIS